MYKIDWLFYLSVLKEVKTMPVFKSDRKIKVFGSSLAMTLPALFVKVNAIEKGSKAQVIHDLNGVLIASWADNLDDLIECLMELLKNIESQTKK